MVDLATSWEEAKEAVLKSGALTVDPEGKLAPGWFTITGAEDIQIPESRNRKTAAIGSIPSAAAFLGAPAAAWTAVGAFGTAATGTSIGALSGAAAVTATASWFERAGIAGAAGLGMRAAPAALGGIGLLATLPVQGVIGAVIAGKNERRKIKQVDEAITDMNRYDSKINHYISEMNHLLQDAQQESANLIRTSSRLSAMMEAHGPTTNCQKRQRKHFFSRWLSHKIPATCSRNSRQTCTGIWHQLNRKSKHTPRGFGPLGISTLLVWSRPATGRKSSPTIPIPQRRCSI